MANSERSRREDKQDDLKDKGAAGQFLSALERSLQEALGKGVSFGLEDDPARTRFPLLWAWLTTAYVGRDHIKTPASFTVRMGPEGVLVSIVDRDLQKSVECFSEHLEGVFAAMEQSLSSPHPPIKSWGKKEPKVRKRISGN